MAVVVNFTTTQDHDVSDFYELAERILGSVY